MRPFAVVVADVDAKCAFEVTAVEDQQPVKTLGADGAGEALRDRVRLRRSHRRLHDPDAVAAGTPRRRRRQREPDLIYRADRRGDAVSKVRRAAGPARARGLCVELVASGGDKCVYGCAYRLVSTGCDSLQFVAASKRTVCRQFQFAAACYRLGRTFNPKVEGSNPSRPIAICRAFVLRGNSVTYRKTYVIDARGA
jgi:hypothetical protein